MIDVVRFVITGMVGFCNALYSGGSLDAANLFVRLI